ncbi:hypothetical protein CDL15_Pgr001331 [Punica granatum]|uniref:Uncharacterized protein n=1 Tax=Punica granatum TaxID=22663 RepID=A0A218WK59_PUNGR|nr:hypothetical protein CDL15_Pgr001331 [Punica granatum]
MAVLALWGDEQQHFMHTRGVPPVSGLALRGDESRAAGFLVCNHDHGSAIAAPGRDLRQPFEFWVGDSSHTVSKSTRDSYF